MTLDLRIPGSQAGGRSNCFILFYESVISPKQKFSVDQNSDFRYTSLCPVPLRRGVLRDRHVTSGAGCDGRHGRQVISPGETSVADGEVVWSWRRDPGVNPCRPVVAG
jgi:hypothetical protein